MKDRFAPSSAHEEGDVGTLGPIWVVLSFLLFVLILLPVLI